MHSIRERIRREYRIGDLETKQFQVKQVFLRDKYQKHLLNHYPQKKCGSSVAKGRLIDLLNFLALVRLDPALCKEIAQSFISGDYECSSGKSNNSTDFIESYPEMTEPLLNVIYGILFSQSGVRLNSTSFPFICTERTYYLQLQRPASLIDRPASPIGRLGVQIVRSFATIETFIASNPIAKSSFSSIVDSLGLGDWRTLMQRKPLLIKKLIAYFDGEHIDQTNELLFYLSIKSDPSFNRIASQRLLKLDLVKKINGAENQKKTLLASYLSRLSRCLQLNSIPAEELPALNSDLDKIFQNKIYESSENASLILRVLKELVQFKNINFLLNLFELSGRHILPLENIDADKIDFFSHCIQEAAQLDSEELGSAIVRFLSVLENKVPALFERVIKNEGMDAVLAKVALKLCEKFHVYGDMAIYALTHSSGKSAAFVAALENVVSFLSPQIYDVTSQQISLIIEGLYRKGMDINNPGLRHKLILFALDRLFVHFKHSLTILSALCNGIRRIAPRCRELLSGMQPARLKGGALKIGGKSF